MLNRKVNKRDKERKRFRKYFYNLVQRFGSFCCHWGFLATWGFWQVFAIPYQIGRPLLMEVVSLPTQISSAVSVQSTQTTCNIDPGQVRTNKVRSK